MHCGPFANIAHGNNSLVADLIGHEARRLRRHRVGLRLRHGDGEVLRHRLPGRRPAPERRRARRHRARAQAPRRARPTTPRTTRSMAADRDRRREPPAATSESSRPSACPAWSRSTAAPATPTRSSSWSASSRSRHGAFAAEVNDGFDRGGAGAADARRRRSSTPASSPTTSTMLYHDDDADRDQDRGGRDARLRRRGRRLLPGGRAQARRSSRADGLGNLPICMAKTHLSLSADPALLNAPGGLHAAGARHPRLHRRRLARAAVRRHPADARPRQAAGGDQRRHRRRRARPSGCSEPSR